MNGEGARQGSPDPQPIPSPQSSDGGRGCTTRRGDHVSPPAVVIRFELERSPTVEYEYLTESEARRMADWIGAHPRWTEIVVRAQDLAEEAKAA